MAAGPSPFLDPGAFIEEGQLALLHLKRDLITPIIVRANNPDSDYAEGNVVNTRFGSFPHSAFLKLPWGSQVRASIVDTGSRGRKKDKKRKREDKGEDDGTPKEISAASTGFAHIMPPTPETWTTSLPHRTQVVYTPDYSYVLQRLRVRPGDTIIEAGAGSGSFTHASCRAIFNGYPLSEPSDAPNGVSKKRKRTHGHVYSFEYHEPRAQTLRQEITAHGLDQLVTVTHRDVYEHGFNIDNDDAPKANAVFLDLPAPWLALRHLTRTPPPQLSTTSTPAPGEPAQPTSNEKNAPFRSPLNPRQTVRICTFSPCIEQVQRTTTEMRKLGWQDIEMVEVLHKRIDVRRERVGLQEEGLRGANPVAASVDEALGRLREVEGRFKEYHRGQVFAAVSGAKVEGEDDVVQTTEKEKKLGFKEARLRGIKEREKERKLWKEGRLVHRTEPEMKTHTSYLCFAVLPRQWTAEDEERARKKWGSKAEGNDEKKGE